MNTLLDVEGLRAGYDDSIVLENISITVNEGEVVALLGANGSGKTTTMRAVTGLIQPFSGKITFDGHDLLAVEPHKRVELGIALCPEGRQVFPNISVEENLFLGSFCKRARPDRRQTLERVYALFPKLAERREQKAGLMSGGEQQMLAVGRALMSKPRMLLLDEPSLGLSPKMVQILFGAIAQVAKSGISILLVEQNAQAAFAVATRGYAIAMGRVTASGTIAELTKSGALQSSFLGSHLPAASA
ncbi:ABC transporter ATP-binding protein [Microbacteriaceae bacterium K1510]|nr:ABC transporter ATP-binding protein [Microbacteriaceae bacterium K1510]